MTTYNTGNPLGSAAAKDLFDNAQNLDFAVNSITQILWSDRFGKSRKTFWGMEQEFSAQLLSQEQRFNQFIQNSGYQVIGDYADGPLTITEYNQLIRYDGELWKLTAATDLPFITTGTDATSWASDSTHFVSVGDAALRQELLSGPIETRGNSLALRNTVTVSDFGGVSGFDNDSTAAITAFINHINSGENDNAVYLIDGLYKTTAKLPDITRPVRITGITTALSAILFSGVSNGLKFDFTSKTNNTVNSKLFSFAILTDMTLAGTGIEYLPNSGGSQTVKLEMDAMRIDTLGKFTGTTSNGEWLVHVKLGDDSITDKPSEVRINNITISGSDLNANYETLTGSGSQGIVASSATNLILTNSKVFLLDSWGVNLKGQTEGCNIHNSQVVATRYGVGITSPSNPSNNHYISNTHIAPYEKGLKVELATAPSTGSPLAVYATNMFILERSDSVNKPGGFIGVDVATRYSKLSNVTVWSNARTAGIHTKIAFRVAVGGNTLIGCHSHNMSYPLEIFDIISGFAYGVSLVDFFEDGTILGIVSPASTQQPYGNIHATFLSRTWKRPLTYANQLTLVNEAGVSFFDINANSTTNKAATGTTTQYIHVPSDQTAAGAAIIGTGGGSTSYQANWILRALNTILSGNLRPETANSGTIGTSAYPFASGYTQTAMQVTSDRRQKTDETDLNDAEKRVGVALRGLLKKYKLSLSVEQKGSAARWHTGVIAQDIISAFDDEGLNATDYAILCHDEWESSPEVLGEDGSVVQEALEAGDRYTVRYDELYGFILAAL